VWREGVVAVIIKLQRLVLGILSVKYQYCCTEMEFATVNAFIDKEFGEFEGGIRLRQNLDLLRREEAITPSQNHPVVERQLSLRFCPFCGKKIRIEEVTLS